MRRRVVWVAGAVLAVLIAAGGAAYLLLAPSDSVRLDLVADTRVAVLTLPGEPAGLCGGRVCRSVLHVGRDDVTKPVTVRPQTDLPYGVRLAYWGCGEGPGAATCTIRPDRDTRICVSTTGPVDVARKACGGSPGTPAAEQSGKLSVILNTRWKIGLFGNFGKPCENDGVLGKKCEITIKPGKIYYLRTQFEKAADPYPQADRTWDFHTANYEGCNSGMGHADSITCVVFGASEPATVCVYSGDPAEQELARECLAHRKAGTP